MKCLYCYKEIESQNKFEFHSACSKKIFETTVPPEIDIELKDIYELASESINKSIAVPGVQQKLSLTVNGNTSKGFTIVGLWGNYILKPPSNNYFQLPEIEDMTMHLAKFFGIETALHSLVRLRSGELAYITKRFDRENSKKISVEDLCQLSGELTEHKYRGSLEKTGKIILKYSDRPGLDRIEFFEVCLFSFLTGNADMHLKNFSMFTDLKTGIKLTPSYDLLSTKLIIPEDNEESALTLNGKKSNLNRKDFYEFANTIEIEKKVFENIFKKFSMNFESGINFLDKGFLTSDNLHKFKTLLTERANRLELIS
ncbi:MAG: HipA domain-containing protein [Ignavibacteria bacterium]